MNSSLTQKQGILLIVMFIMGTSLLLVMGMEAKTDIWIAIILGMVASAIVMLIYVRLLTLMPEKDFFETLEYFLGKVGSKIIILLFTWFCFDLCAIVLRNFGEFVITVGLKETPVVVIMGVMIVLCALAVRYGINAIARWNEFFVFVVIGFIVISIGLVTINMEINNLLPVFDGGITPILQGAFGVMTFPFIEVVVFLLVFPKFTNKTSVKKVFLKGLFFGGIIIFITSITDVLVLGTDAANSLYYPTYSAMSTIHIGDFIYRLEAIGAIVFIFAVFIKITILLYGACNGTARLFGLKDNRFIVIPICFLVLNFAVYSFESMIQFQVYTRKVWRWYGAVFEIVLPLITLIIIEIRRKSMNIERYYLLKNKNNS